MSFWDSVIATRSSAWCMNFTLYDSESLWAEHVLELSPADDVMKSLSSVLAPVLPATGNGEVESFSICALVLEEVLPKPARDRQIKPPT